MADLTPTGPLAVAVDALRSLVANTPFFQDWTDSPDEATALLRVYTADIGVRIATVTIAAGVLTLGTQSPHDFEVGDVLIIAGAGLGPQSPVNLTGALTVTAVTTDTLTFATAMPDVDTFAPGECYLTKGPRPLAFVGPAESNALRASSIGTGGASIYAGELLIILEADVSTQYQSDATNATIEAQNAFGEFWQSLSETAGTGDLMVINGIEPASGPDFNAIVSQDDNRFRFERWMASFRVSWGVSA